MKGNNGVKILKLFDYFKTAFEVNIHNRRLYKPQIIYLVLRGVLIFMTGITIVDLFSTLSPFIGTVNPGTFFSILWSEFRGTPLLVTAVTLIVTAFGSTYVEAGLYAMYAKIIDGEEDEDIIFAAGANRYFLSFLGGNILIALFWLLILLPYFIVGALTLTLGFIWIPIMIDAMLMVWKSAIVSDDVHILNGIKNSIAFGKRHFIPANVFIVVKSALSTIASGGSGNGGNIQNVINNDIGDGFGNLPGNGYTPGPFANFDFSFFKLIIMIALSLVSIMSILSGMIKMIFDIFFGLTAVIIYKDDWYTEPTEDIPTPEIQEMEVE